MEQEFKYNEKYRFTEKWFDSMIPTWNQLFKKYGEDIGEINSVLEIGCFEGRATTWICENVLHEKDGQNYDVVDTFGGTLEEPGMVGTADRLKSNNFIEDNFMHNISFFKNINFNIYKNYSNKVLPELCLKDKKYDFIYIDASHKADDTFVDAYYADKLLNVNGLLIFDDYGWHDPNDTHINNSPKAGVDVFRAFYEKKYSLVGMGYQVILIKNKI